MKSLSEYLLGVKKEYEIKVRIAADLQEADLDKIERCLSKYELLKISAPKKTIFQNTAYGFEQPVNSEVMILDVTLGLPFSAFHLQDEIAKSIKVCGSKVAVTDSNQEDGDKVKLPVNTVGTYIGDQTRIPPTEMTFDRSAFYGEEYNEKMIKSLKDAREEIRKS